MGRSATNTSSGSVAEPPMGDDQRDWFEAEVEVQAAVASQEARSS